MVAAVNCSNLQRNQVHSKMHPPIETGENLSLAKTLMPETHLNNPSSSWQRQPRSFTVHLPKRGWVETKCKTVLAADTACSAQLPKARQWTQGRGAIRKHANCILFNLHVHFVFAFKQLLQVFVCWAEITLQAVVSVSRLAVWHVSMKVLDLVLLSEKLLRIRLQELLKSLSLSLTKMQRKTRHGANQGKKGKKST